ncbi:MAG TPA: hypothetical protein ENI29_19580 [bacterium]|nr:hypothetical protein [bacterium]
MMQKSKKSRGSYSRRKKKSKRVTGDALLYFCLHNLISVFFFFLFTIRLEVYDGMDIPVAFLFTSEFWEMVIFQVLLFSIVSSIIGRSTAFLIIKGYFKYGTKKTMKRWSELNRGINNFSLIIFLVTALITSIVYSLGIVIILQDRIFSDNSILTLIFTYILFKTGVFFFIRWLVGSKI